MKKIWIYPVIFSAICGFLSPLAGPEFGNIFLAHLPTIIIFYFILCWIRAGRLVALFGSYALGEIYFGTLHQYGLLDWSTGLLGLMTYTVTNIALAFLEELKPDGFKTVNVAIQCFIVATGFIIALLLLGQDLDTFNSVIANFDNYEQKYFATDAFKQLSVSVLSTSLLTLPMVFIPTYILQKKTGSKASIAHASFACMQLVIITMSIFPLIGAFMVGLNPICGSDMDKFIPGELMKEFINRYYLPLFFLAALSLILTFALETFWSYLRGDKSRLWVMNTQPTKKEPRS